MNRQGHLAIKSVSVTPNEVSHSEPEVLGPENIYNESHRQMSKV